MRAATRVLYPLLAVVLGAALLAGCGGSPDAKQLLQQTFGGQHTVNSGRLAFSLSLTPSGSSTLTAPLSLSFGGPFQSRGSGQLPASDFNLSVSGLGHTGSLGILSTGSAGYVSLQGTNYALPAATFQKLESSFASVTKSGGGSGSGTLSKLGIDPMRWLTSPTVVGNESVAGAPVTHVRAGIDVAAFLGDLNTLLQRASSLGVSGAGALSGGIPPATRQKIADSVHGARIDVWTGRGDHTLRRLTLALAVPVTGQISTALGGLRSAAIALDMEYAGLNQPQSISAPASARPFTEFQTKLQGVLQTLQGAAQQSLGAAGSGAGATGAAGSSGTSTGSASSLSSYSQCLQSAGTDVTKMQSCAALLNGK